MSVYLRSDKIKTEQHLQMTETGNNDDLKTQTELLDRVAQIEQQISKRIVGQKTVIRQLLIALCASGWRAGSCQDSAGSNPCTGAFAGVFPNSIYTGPNASGYHRDRSNSGR